MKEGKPGTGIVDNLLGRKNNCHIFIGMSWRTIIESIGARIENEERAAMLEEVEDLTDAEHAGVYLHERLRGSLGRFVAVSLEKAQLSGTLEESGKDWFVLKGMQEVTSLCCRLLRECPAYLWRSEKNRVIRVRSIQCCAG